jgi:hypothetical protein
MKLIVLIFVILCFGCKRYLSYPNYNKNSSTFEVITGDIGYLPNSGLDTSLIIFTFYGLGAGGTHKFSKKEHNSLILKINNKEYPIDDTGTFNYYTKSGMKEFSVIDKNNFRRQLSKKRILVTRNVSININIYLIYDMDGLKKKRESWGKKRRIK